MDLYICVRIDIQNPLLHHFRFIFSDCLMGRDDLTVQICQAHLIVIDQIKCTNPASCQRLADITTHASDSKHGNAGIMQLLHCIFSKQQLCSRKLCQHLFTPVLFFVIRLILYICTSLYIHFCPSILQSLQNSNVSCHVSLTITNNLHTSSS